MRPDEVRPKIRFDVNDPRFAGVQELFATMCPEEGRALLRDLTREWLARHTKEEAEEIGRDDDAVPVADTSQTDLDEADPGSAGRGVA